MTILDLSQALTKTPSIPEKKPSFWFLHIGGWLSYFVIFVAENLAFNSVTPTLLIVAAIFFSCFLAILLTYPLRFIYRRCIAFPPKPLIATMIACSLLVALIWTPTKNIVIWSLVEGFSITQMLSWEYEDHGSPMLVFETFSYSFFMVLIWSSCYFGITYHCRLLHEKELHLNAARLSHSAQIKMLRYQINPHFLFNTLNAVSTLVLKAANDKANGMLVRLSTFLRYSLDNDPEKKIRLYEELEALMLYLEIEKTRFDERLSVRFKVDVDTEALLVPSLLLQPLVENSIKYAIAKMSAGGEIEITAKRQHNLLHLEIADNGPTPQSNSCESFLGSSMDKHGNGVGLRNIYERLNVLYPDHFTLKIEKNVPNGMKVRIEIPIEVS